MAFVENKSGRDLTYNEKPWRDGQILEIQDVDVASLDKELFEVLADESPDLKKEEKGSKEL